MSSSSSSSYIFHGVGPLVDPFRSHESRSLFKGLSVRLPVVKISPEWVTSRVSPVVGLLPLASGPACLGMAFPPFLVKQVYRCDSVVISPFVITGYTMRR